MTKASPNLYVGTAGWSYKDWCGVVYPEPRPRGFSELLYLAQLFNVVEVNTSFYHIPAVKMTERWARLVSDIPDFLESGPSPRSRGRSRFSMINIGCPSLLRVENPNIVFILIEKKLSSSLIIGHFKSRMICSFTYTVQLG